MPSKKKTGKKNSVKVTDLQAKNNPKGGLTVTKVVDKTTPVLMTEVLSK